MIMMKLLAAFFLFLLGAIEVAAGDTNTNTTAYAYASASASAAAGAGDSELSAKVRAHLSKLTARSDGGPNARVTCTDGIAEAGEKLIVVLCSCSPSCIRLSLAHLSFSFYHILLCTNNIIHSRLHRWRDGTDWSLATR